MIGDKAPGRVFFLPVQCGTWAADYAELQAVAGQPARSLLCLFEVPEGVNRDKCLEGQDIDHFMLILDVEGCFPSGVEFNSGTALEKLTSKHRIKQYTRSCRILHQGQPLCSVEQCLEQKLPRQRLVRKSASNRRFLGGSPARLAHRLTAPTYSAPASTYAALTSGGSGVRNMPVSLGYAAAVQVAELALKAGDLELMKAIVDGANFDHIGRQAAADINIATKLLCLLERITKQLPTDQRGAAAGQAGGWSAGVAGGDEPGSDGGASGADEVASQSS
eukprot:gene13367-13494_t